MARISDKELATVKELYYQRGYSMREIAIHLGVSLNAVVYFMRRFDLKRRDSVDCNAAAFARKPITYNIKAKLSREEEKLKSVAVTLYWAEGTKSEGHPSVDFANSDPNMIEIFMRFLRNICGIDESRVRLYLYCYANQNPRKLQAFWSKVASVPLKQCTKPYVRQDYREDGRKMQHGLIHIRYADKKLLHQIKVWIKEEVDDILSA